MITQALSYSPVEQVTFSQPRTGKGGLRPIDSLRLIDAALGDAGIGGTVRVWYFVSEEGVVKDTRVSRTSGQAQLDDAALRVAEVMRFTPAMNGTEPVAVRIEVPVTFQVR